MPEQRSLIVYGHYRDATQRFEYFVVGLSGTLCAYVSQHLQPQKIGFNPYSLELFALLLLTGSVVAGLRRIQWMILAEGVNHAILDAAEKRGGFMDAYTKGGTILNVQTGGLGNSATAQAEIEKLTRLIDSKTGELERKHKQSLRLYRIRNWLLFFGFLGLIFARVLLPYSNT